MMNCTEVGALLDDYVDGALSPGDQARLDEHLADRRRGEEAGQLGDPVLAELVLAGPDQGPVLLAGRLADRVAPQVDNALVPRRLRSRGGHGTGSFVLVVYLRMTAVIHYGNSTYW